MKLVSSRIILASPNFPLLVNRISETGTPSQHSFNLKIDFFAVALYTPRGKAANLHFIKKHIVPMYKGFSTYSLALLLVT